MGSILKISLVLAVFLVGQTALPADQGYPIRWGVDVGEVYKATPLDQPFRQLVNSALMGLQNYPPQGNHLFKWLGSTETLRNKEVLILLTDSFDDILADVTRQQPQWIFPETSSATVHAVSTATKDREASSYIIVFLFMDRLYFDEAGQIRTDAFSRIMVALANEIFVHVKYYLEYDLASAKPMFWQEQRQMQIQASRGTIAFIHRILRSEGASVLPGKNFLDLSGLIPIEESHLRGWERMTEPPTKSARVLRRQSLHHPQCPARPPPVLLTNSLNARSPS